MDPVLDPIADLLERRRLTDPEVLEEASWRAVVRPATQPFLARVREAVGWPWKGYQPSPAAQKRETFDALRLPLGDLNLVVHVGLADVPEGDLERALSWGVRWWGAAAEAAAVAERLRSLDVPGFQLRTIASQPALASSGTTAYLYRARTPADLRGQDVGNLIDEIAADLARLRGQLEQAAQAEGTAAGGGELSAAGLVAWLRAAHGLHFTPAQVAAFVTALQAKGFVILSGLSGTGKTQLAVRIAELVLGRVPEVVPVRPDWRDSRSLLGYYHPIGERYVSTPLLRALLAAPASSAVPSEPRVNVSLLREAVRSRERVWVPRLREMVSLLENRDPATLTSAELNRLWHEQSNGVSNIGQAVVHPLRATPEVLRETTARLMRPVSPGEALVDASHYLHEQTGAWHWARMLRMLATAKLDLTCTVSNHQVLDEVLRALGFQGGLALPQAVQARDSARIDAAFRFLRRWIDGSLSDLDRYERALAPWQVYRLLQEGRLFAEGPGEGEPVPHRFLILDEMNLARVEYYFAEFLSVLESDRDPATGQTRQHLPLHGERTTVPDGPPEDPATLMVPATLPLPPHLFVVGTVNTDETTHAFSPKVLDRAFTIEFNDVDLGETGGEAPPPAGAAPGAALAQLLREAGPAAGRAAARRALADPRFLRWLTALYDRLRPHDLHFGFRVRDEVARFVGYACASPLADGFAAAGDVFTGAFDAAVLMKVLPKFHGPRAKLERPLVHVLAWAVAPDAPDAAVEPVRQALAAAGTESAGDLLAAAGSGDAALPRTAEKAARMLYEVATVGFTTFA